MRIIAGEFGGRKLLSPEGEVTRPITDRVKQSLFDILAPGLPGAVVYDLFAGTGSMGLECLSRGARHVTFFEIHRSALARLSQNITALRVQDRSRVIAGDLFKWFQRDNIRPDTVDESRAEGPGLTPEGSGFEVHRSVGPSSLSPEPLPRSSPRRGADLVFLDPPYRFLTDRPDELLQLSLHLAHAHLKPTSTVVFRHDTKDDLDLPHLTRYDLRDYGGMTVELLRKADAVLAVTKDP